MSQTASTPSKKRGCVKGCLFTLVGMILIVEGCMYFSDPNLSWNKPHALAITREWARLAPLPVPNDRVNIVTQGSGFTRTFFVTFTAKPEEILAWLQASPGTQQTFSERQTLEDQKIEITPGGGAMHAEITISEHGTKVVIHTYWS